VIKRITFASRRAGLTPPAFATAWRAAVVAHGDAGDDVRPVRVALCTVAPELSDDEPRHDAIAIEWFTDEAHAERFAAWLGDRAVGAELLDPGTSAVVLATEHVLRGGDWLDQRWRDGGPMFKHMAIARRAAGLSPAEFSERWRSRAGTVAKPGESAVTVIPEEARGLAYVQNHPCPLADGDWAYDAINEVWFTDAESLAVRIAWFREHLGSGTEEDLVQDSSFLALREEVIVP
jgi:hypothetical protein